MMDYPIPATSIGIYFLAPAVIVGLIVRGTWRLSPFFLAYSVTGLVSAPLQRVWPEHFYSQSFWILNQAAFDILKFGLALEIAWRTFRVFTGAARAARNTVLMILGATTTAAIFVPLTGAAMSTTAYQMALGEFHPRVIDGTIWLMAATLLLARWYRVPLHPFHSAGLTGLSLYLAFYSTLLRSFALYDFDTVRAYLNALDPLATLMMLCWFAYTAWRPESAIAKAHAETLEKLRLRDSSTREPAVVGAGLLGVAR